MGVLPRIDPKATGYGEKELKNARKNVNRRLVKRRTPHVPESDDLHISPFRENGSTYGTPTWIWSVVVDDSLYVRAYNGQSSRWCQAAMRQRAGRITAAGLTKEVSFEPVIGPVKDRIHEAYRAK